MGASLPPARRRQSERMRRCGKPTWGSRRTSMPDANLLEVSSIETCYGLSQVLFGVSFAIAPGQMVTLLGRNGMGKTTTVRSVMGLTPAMKGSIRLAGTEIRGMPAYRVPKLGVWVVSGGRAAFTSL